MFLPCKTFLSCSTFVLTHLLFSFFACWAGSLGCLCDAKWLQVSAVPHRVFSSCLIDRLFSSWYKINYAYQKIQLKVHSLWHIFPILKIFCIIWKMLLHHKVLHRKLCYFALNSPTCLLKSTKNGLSKNFVPNWVFWFRKIEFLWRILLALLRLGFWLRRRRCLLAVYLDNGTVFQSVVSNFFKLFSIKDQTLLRNWKISELCFFSKELLISGLLIQYSHADHSRYF